MMSKKETKKKRERERERERKERQKNLFPGYINFININRRHTYFSFRMKVLTMLCSLIACSQTLYFLLKGSSSAQGVRVGKQGNRRIRSCHGMDLINLFSPKDVHRRSFVFFLELRARSCIRDCCRKEKENDVCVQASSLTKVYGATNGHYPYL